MTPPRSTALDLIRAASALVVMCGHLRNALLPDYYSLVAPNLGWKLFYLVSGMGHQAVIVFFVLSGYLVGGSVIKSGTSFRWSDYAITRLCRLWIVLVPALVATALLDHLLLQLNPQMLGGSYVAWHSVPVVGDYSASFATALQNLFFLQTITAPTFGTNGPLWSLANEAWYYLLFPCLWLAFDTGRSMAQRGVMLAVFGLAMALLPTAMLSLFIVWLLGAALHVVPKWPMLRTRGYALASFALVALVLVAARLAVLPGKALLLPDHALGLALTLWCLHLHATGGKPSRLPAQRLIHGLADMSYTLYLVHMPLVFLLVILASPHGKRAADLHGLAMFTALAAVVTAAAWGCWWLFERRTATLRTWLLGLSSRSRVTAKPALRS